MSIATTVQRHLDQHKVDYDIVFHPQSHSNLHSARLAGLPPDCIAKAVILEDDAGYVMAVIPTSRRVHLGMLSRELGRPLRLARESELGTLFGDCRRGAVPPVGIAYGVETLLDEDLGEKSDIYFEAGDHEELIHLKGAEFMAVMQGARRGHYCVDASKAESKRSGSSDPRDWGFYGS